MSAFGRGCPAHGVTGRKQDIKDVERVAKEFGMEREQCRDFGDFLEDCKRFGDRGTKNSRGYFTEAELKEKAREFLADEFGA